MAIKGYVVRYTNDRRTFYVTAPKWLDDFTIGSRADEGSLFETLGGATAAARHPRRVSDVAIFRVLDDGREERLPSYEEALGEIERIKAPVIGRVSHDCGDATCPRRGPVIESPTCKRAEEFERQISPLAALEAAERWLLEAGGWTIAEPDEYGGERWNHEEAGKEARSTAIVIARRMAEIERRRLAAKGCA